MFRFLLCFVIFGFVNLNAQVLINEFSGANYSDVTDNFGDNEDWIELYNTGAASFDLSGYHLSDREDNPMKWAFPAGTSIAGSGFLRVWLSGRDEGTGANLHASFKLTQTKEVEVLLFADPTGAVIDINQIVVPNKSNESWGRNGDGNSSWGVLENPTPNASNTDVQLPYTPKPEFDQVPGHYGSAISLGLSSLDATATIYYTTDGSEPTTASIEYTAPINISNTTVIRAAAFSSAPNAPSSHIETNTYFIGADSHSLPVISVAGDDVLNLLNNNLFDGYNIGDAYGNFEYFDENQNFLSESSGEFNKHGNDSWAYDQRGFDYITRDQFGTNYGILHQIFPSKDRDEFQRLIIKAAANDNYPAEPGAHIRDAYIHTLSQRADLRLDERTSQFCIVYANGDYWGVYDVREKVDDNDFTKHYYDQGRKWIDYIKTWGATWVEYGTMNDWNDLYDYIVGNDMTDEANYTYVKSQLNTGSLIDYILINTHLVCADWLNYNTAWWRGRNPDGDKKKWRYTLWDMDASLGHYINYTGMPSQDADADPCDVESPSVNDPEGHVDLLVALYENENFYADYVNRYADLNNTAFSCDFMIPLLDEMLNEITPEMTRQISRWGGSMAGWQSEVQELREFIMTRCTVIDSGIEDCYDVDGPYPITIIVEPPGAGTIDLNSLELDTFPWNGDYFGGVNLSFEAIATGTNTFSYWETNNHPPQPNSGSVEMTINITQGDTIIAHFGNPDRNLVFVVDPPNAGTFSVNTFTAPSFPWNTTFADGSTIDFEATAAAGYSFSNWGSNEHTFTPDATNPLSQIIAMADDTITAYFNQEGYGIVYSTSDGGGTILVDGSPVGDPETVNYVSGDPASFEAIPDIGFEFDGWTILNHSLADLTSTTGSISVTSNDSLTATFSQIILDIELDILIPDGATVTVNGTVYTADDLPTTIQVPYGESIDVETTLDDGFTFDGWTTSTNANTFVNVTNSSTSITITENGSIDFDFTSPIPTYEVEINTADEAQGGVNVNGVEPDAYPFSLIIEEGESLALVAIPAEGFAFDYWEFNSTIISNADLASQNLVINADDILIAHFIAVLPDCTPLIPTAFSPNNDGTNDLLRAIYPCSAQNTDFKVFNRFGNIVFSSSDPAAAWDGFNGADQQDLGVYIWVLSYEAPDDNGDFQKDIVKGNVTLIR